MDEFEQSLARYIRSLVAQGFEGEDEILESALSYAEDEAKGRDVRPLAERLLKEAMAAHRTAQASWPATTDCDRLDAAFAELEMDGIVARQHFTCCQTCGHAEIDEEIEEAEKRGKVQGYVFYHWQDTESAAQGHGIALAYGSVTSGAESAEAVGRRAVRALAEAGLETEWDGSVENRIIVKMDWKKRR